MHADEGAPAEWEQLPTLPRADLTWVPQSELFQGTLPIDASTRTLTDGTCRSQEATSSLGNQPPTTTAVHWQTGPCTSLRARASSSMSNTAGADKGKHMFSLSLSLSLSLCFLLNTQLCRSLTLLLQSQDQLRRARAKKRRRQAVRQLCSVSCCAGRRQERRLCGPKEEERHSRF